jgi:hypothetical protein
MVFTPSMGRIILLAPNPRAMQILPAKKRIVGLIIYYFPARQLLFLVFSRSPDFRHDLA